MPRRPAVKPWTALAQLQRLDNVRKEQLKQAQKSERKT